MFDRIELGTYLIAGALIAKKNLILEKINPKIIKMKLIFKKNGC